uniref:Uncharacterized protein n=1 Tax=Oryza meridionalis TaxID=40149 RepID=A0A0E0EMU1_9ORYZ
MNGIAGDSSYSAASRSVRCAPLKSFGRMYCLTGTSSMIMRGKRTPAIGIHVIPKQTMKSSKILSQNWLPGKLSMAMKAK